MAKSQAMNVEKKALEVNGVGQGSQHCHYDVMLPVSFQDTRNQQVEAAVKSATVTGSDLPGLLGLGALEKLGAVLDLRTGTLYPCGQGDQPLSEGLPPGTLEYKLEKAESGHLMLPCCNYGSASRTSSIDPSSCSCGGNGAKRSHEEKKVLILTNVPEPARPAPEYVPNVTFNIEEYPPAPTHAAEE